MKRIISAILLLVLLATALVGCGESETKTTSTTKRPATESHVPEDTPTDTTDGSQATTELYVVSASSNKFHLPDCAYAKKISDDNREEYSLTYAEMISKGYFPCGHCLASYESTTTEPSADSTAMPDSTATPSTGSVSDVPNTESTSVPVPDDTVTPSTGDNSDAISTDTSAAHTETTEVPPTTETPEGELHILNTGTKKIHKPDCRYANNKNREEYNGDINDLLEEGYTLCKTCHKD